MQKFAKKFLTPKKNQIKNRNVLIMQWANLLEAIEEGAQSISVTPQQMAEELPDEMTNDVNIQLALKGCCFRVRKSIKP